MSCFGHNYQSRREGGEAGANYPGSPDSGGGSRLLNGPPEVLRNHEVAAIASWGTPLDRILCWRRLSGRRAMIATHHPLFGTARNDRDPPPAFRDGAQ